MGTMQYPGPNLTFDPSKQTYLDYINQLTGYQQPQQPQNSFPAETAAPSAPPPQQPQQNPVSQGAEIYAGHQAMNQVGQMLPSAEVSTPVSGAPAGGGVGTPLSQTESVMQGGDVATQSTPVVGGMTPVAGADAGGIANTGWGASAMPYVAPAAVGAIGAYTASKGLDAWNNGKNKGVMGGLKEGIHSAGPLNFVPLLGQLPWAAGAIRGAFGGKKDQDQYGRDSVRSAGQDAKWFDSNFQVPLGDITLDMGKDGGFKYGQGTPGERPVYNIDWDNDPNASQAVGWLRPLAAVLAKGDKKLTDDFTAQFYNELTKDGGATDLASIRKRVVELYNHFQLRPSIVRDAINSMDWDQGTKDAAFAAIDNLRPGQDFQVKPGIDPMRPGAAMGAGATDVKPMPRDNLSSAMGAGGGKARVSPGIWKDQKGEYKSVDGVRR